MVYAIDRIEGGIAVCECIESGAKRDVAVKDLPENACEGDLVHVVDGVWAIDVALTAQRRAEMAERLKKLFDKSFP